MQKVEEVIFYSIDKAIKTYRQFAQREIKKAGFPITVDQWLIMKSIEDNPGISQLQVARKVFKDNASVTRIIGLLIKNKLLERKINFSDKRRVNLNVTRHGKKIISDVQLIILNNRQHALRNINAIELKTARNVLQKIILNCNGN